MRTRTLLRGAAAMPALAATLASACTTDDPSPSPIAVLRDSAGVEIVENAAPTGAEVATWTLSGRAIAIIGEDEDEPGHLLTEVIGGFVLGDGRIVVGDRGSGEVRFFDAGGRHLRSVGGPGEGPGEFRILMWVDRVPGDTIVAGAWPLGRRVWWNSRGEYLDNTTSGRWGPGLVGGRTLPDRTFLIDVYEGGSYGNSLEFWAATGEESTFRTRGTLLRVTQEGEPQDTIGPVVGEEWFKVGELGPTGIRAVHARPFTYRTHLAFTENRIYLGESHQGEVRAYALDGTLIRMVRWEQRRTPITAGDRRAVRNDVLERLNNPTRRPAYERWLAEVPYPESKPAFRGFETDTSGRLWVQTWTLDEAVDRWLVFEADGRLTATLSVTSDARLLDAGEQHVLVVTTDELGVETVRLFGLLKTTG